MKSKKVKIGAIIFLAAGIVAWSPGTSEDLVIGPNTFISPVGVLGVVGSSNAISARSSFVVGESNNLTNGQSSNYAQQTLVSGAWNVVNTGTIRSMINGHNNNVRAGYSFVSGYENFVNGPANAVIWNSAVLGVSNQLSSTGWVMGRSNVLSGNDSSAIGSSNTLSGANSAAIGSSNNVTGTYSCALGGGLDVDHAGVTAVGFWNAPTQDGDAMVVGAGTPAAPSTALRVTYAGDVILGRAQGDISMGIYGGN